jgi:L-aminopeptidase/D-esterase-like protein
MLDGDTIFSLSVPGNAALTLPDHEAFEVTDIIGAAAADAMVLALLDAFFNAEGIPDFPSLAEVLAGFKKESTHE